MAANSQDNSNDDTASLLIEARSVVRMPATLLILVGILSLLIAIRGINQIDKIPPVIDQFIAALEADPNIPKAEKEQQIDVCVAAKDAAEERTPFLTYYTLSIICSAIVVLGGINMLRLSGPNIPILSAILVTLPGVSAFCCCCLGTPVGLWALVVLNRPDIRSAMALKSRTTSSDESYDRDFQ